MPKKYLPSKEVVIDTVSNIFAWLKTMSDAVNDPDAEHDFRRGGIIFKRFQRESGQRRAAMQLSIRRLLNMDSRVGLDILTHFEYQQFCALVTYEKSKWTGWTESESDEISGMLRFVRKFIDSPSPSKPIIEEAMRKIGIFAARGLIRVDNPSQEVVAFAENWWRTQENPERKKLFAAIKEAGIKLGGNNKEQAVWNGLIRKGLVSAELSPG
jgi:hypothetical protein